VILSEKLLNGISIWPSWIPTSIHLHLSFRHVQTGGGTSISNYSRNAIGNCGLKSMQAVDKHAEKDRRSHGPKLIHTIDTRTSATNAFPRLTNWRRACNWALLS